MIPIERVSIRPRSLPFANNHELSAWNLLTGCITHSSFWGARRSIDQIPSKYVTKTVIELCFVYSCI